jgi:putative heme-binding domain-containing protein
MMGSLLANPAMGIERKLFLLDTIDDCSVEEFPVVWREALGTLIGKSEVRQRMKALTMIAQRRIPHFGDLLERTAANEGEEANVRTAALGALVSQRPGLTEPQLRFLLSLLPPTTNADLRLSAAQVLAKAGLTDEQLTALARECLPETDPLLVPTLLDAFRRNRRQETGMALVAGLSKAGQLGSVAGERLRELLEAYPPAVRSAAAPLLAQVEEENRGREKRLRELEPLLRAGGDPGRGREVFFGTKVGCSSCHTIGAEGEDVGPDLTGVGSVRSGIDILEAIVFPSASFVPGKEVYRVETRHGTYTGVRWERTPDFEDSFVLVSGPRERIRIRNKDIVSMKTSPVSLMPDGFDKDLTKQELTDLLAFLTAQKSRPEETTTDASGEIE